MEKSPEKFCPSCGEEITDSYIEDDFHECWYCDDCELAFIRDEEECPAKN